MTPLDALKRVKYILNKEGGYSTKHRIYSVINEAIESAEEEDWIYGNEPTEDNMYIILTSEGNAVGALDYSKGQWRVLDPFTIIAIEKEGIKAYRKFPKPPKE